MNNVKSTGKMLAVAIVVAGGKRDIWEELDEPTREMFIALADVFERMIRATREEMKDRSRLWVEMLVTTRKEIRRRFKDEADKRRNG